MLNNVMLPSNQTNRLREMGSARIAGCRILSTLAILSCAMLVFGNMVAEYAAGDWPQINGPNRDGVAVGESLLAEWPKGGLKQIWTHSVGQGNAGPAVVGEKVIVFHRPGKAYLVEALNSKTGKPIWSRELTAEYRGGMDGDLGPKCVPLIHGDLVFLYGPDGTVFCLNHTDGNVVWKKNVSREFKSRSGFFGVGTTPIVIDGQLILNAGGRDASIVSLDANSGNLSWKAFNDDASYSSPIEIMLENKKVVVFVTRLHLVGLDAGTGEVLFQTPFGNSGPTVNAAMPVSIRQNDQEYLFASAAYRVGARLMKVSADEVDKIWGNDTTYSSQYSTPVFADGSLFGTAGREDFKNGSFRCFDALSGNVHWTQDDFPVGHSILVGKQVIVLDSTGGFHVINANKTKFDQVYQTKLFDSESRAMPAISDGLFYARSNSDRAGKGTLVCVEVGVQQK